jgi:hypothetical protein
VGSHAKDIFKFKNVPSQFSLTSQQPSLENLVPERNKKTKKQQLTRQEQKQLQDDYLLFSFYFKLSPFSIVFTTTTTTTATTTQHHTNSTTADTGNHCTKMQASFPPEV